jgi:hypothetical protein
LKRRRFDRAPAGAARFSAAGISLWLALLGGCGGGGGGAPPADGGGCGAPALIQSRCAISPCHDAVSKQGDLDLETAGVAARLVGVSPDGTGGSFCAGFGPYLVPQSSPATGLFLDKLQPSPLCGVQMPNLGLHLSAIQISCLTDWATGLTTQ